nr:uncharacterized protein LOC123751122 [Procambarus clarkii]
MPHPLPVPLPSLDTSRVLESTLLPAVCLPSPNPVSLDGGGFLPRIVEAAVLRDRAAPALGPPADGSSGAPLAPANTGRSSSELLPPGNSSDDERPISKSRRSARDASPRRTWAEERDALDDLSDVLPPPVVPSVLDTVAPAGGSPQWAVALGDRDPVVVLSKDVRRGDSAPVLVGGGPGAPAEPPSAGFGAVPDVERRVHPSVRPEVRPSPTLLVSPASSAAMSLPPVSGSSSSVSCAWRRPPLPDVVVPELMEYPRYRVGRAPMTQEYLICEAYKRRYPQFTYPEKYPPV